MNLYVLTVDCDGGGLKLLALEYWLYAERGVKTDAEDGIKPVLVDLLCVPILCSRDLLMMSLITITIH